MTHVKTHSDSKGVRTSGTHENRWRRPHTYTIYIPQNKIRVRGSSPLARITVAVFALACLFVGLSSIAAGETIVVAADGTGDNQTIQDGVDAATVGDTVEVQSGTYNETVIVDKEITLVAPNGALLNGSSFGTDSTGIYVDRNVSTGLTIDGFTVESYGDGISVGASTDEVSDDSYEFDGTAGGWVIQNVVVRDNVQDGIDVAGTTTAAWAIDNVTATSNGDEGLEIGYEVNGVDPNQDWIVSNINASKNGEYGIRVGYEQGAWTIENTTTNDNGDSSESGVQVYQSGSNWSIADHTATGNDGSGIDVPSGDAGLIERANLSENRQFGFEAPTDGDWTLRDSLVLNNGEDGVYDNTASSFLVDNVTIRGNGHDGVFLLDNSGDWQILDSVIKDNGATDSADRPGAGIDAERTSGSWAVNNTSITGNEDAGIYAQDAQITGDATDNWWGQTSGPASGQCVGNVDCSSPLTSEPGTTEVQETVSAPNCSTVGYNGDGTTSTPYEVGNLSQLQCMGNTSSNTGLGEDFIQVSDIDSSDTSVWNSGKGFKPIGNDSARFNGTFNGSGFTVTDFYINRSRVNVNGTGLFGRTGSAAIIENVGLENVSVNNPTYGSVGGLVGWNGGATVRESYATGSVTGYGKRVGGLVGYSRLGTVNSSSATSSVNGSDNVGGLVGYNSDGIVDSSYATGAVNGSGGVVGGLIGYNSGTVRDSNSTGDVSGSSTVGGLVGQNSNPVESSYATGNVSGSGGGNVGGLVGYIYGGEVSNSYATGYVSGFSNVGGLVGENFNFAGSTGVTVNTSYATGYVSGSSNVSGLVGFDNGGGMAYSYWDTNTTNQTTSSGSATGLTTSEMKGSNASENMCCFDFTNTWDVIDNSDRISYPYLRANTQTPAPGLETVSTSSGESGSISLGESGGGDNTYNSPPEPEFEVRGTMEAGEEVTLDASASSDSDGTIQQYRWNINYDDTKTGVIINHTFEQAGLYKVELTVGDDGPGRTKTKTTGEVLNIDVSETESGNETVEESNETSTNEQDELEDTTTRGPADNEETTDGQTEDDDTSNESNEEESMGEGQTDGETADSVSDEDEYSDNTAAVGENNEENAPGFTVVAAVIALLAVALRRRG